MEHAVQENATQRYANCIEASKRIRWDIDRDVIRGRSFDHSRKFLPDALSRVPELPALSSEDARMASQIQGRTYANMFGLCERFIGAKMLEISRDHWLGDQIALQALVRFTDEELKHQELFRRLESMMAEGMPEGYRFVPEPNAVAQAVLGASNWAVLALTCHIEIFTQSHYRQSIESDAELSELWKDVFLYHWREESQHAILDEIEWRRENDKLDAAARDRAVDDLIALVVAVDGILQTQANADAEYFVHVCPGAQPVRQLREAQDLFLRAYRWQYIGSGVQEPRFQALLGDMIDTAQGERIAAAVAPIVGPVR